MQDIDLSDTIQAKSNQLNAVDLIGYELVIVISDVKKVNDESQPIWVYYDGCNNRPWKPNKGMRRALLQGWGKMKSEWIGKSVKLFCNPEVKWAGAEAGGIEISAMSDIKDKLKNDGMMHVPKRLNRSKVVIHLVELLDTTRPQYPQDKFESGINAMAKAMQDGKMTLQQVIARCQQTGDLTQEQLAVLQSHAPIEMNEDGEIK